MTLLLKAWFLCQPPTPSLANPAPASGYSSYAMFFSPLRRENGNLSLILISQLKDINHLAKTLGSRLDEENF